jgi:ArsR family transcriptional regulator
MDRSTLYELHARFCEAFTSPKRLEILSLLRDRELCVGDLSKLANVPQSNVSQHLAVLRSRRIVATRREGVTIYYSLANPKVIRAFDTITEVLLEELSHTEKLSKDLRKARTK